MTKRLYNDDVMLDRCEAVVLRVNEEGGRFEALTDATVIFPESGGQVSDSGSINGIPVPRAREDGEDVWHTLDKPVSVGERVTISVDMAARMDHSQQHTGEHIVSGLANKLFGAKNVGFHMAEDHATLDLDILLDDAQLEALALAANAVVQSNIPVRAEVVDAETLKTLTLRKKAEGLSGDIRIVYIDGVDSCTCCGTHCKTTGEVGYIMLTSSMKYKGGIRIWFDCGQRAVRESLWRQSAVAKAARRFSVKEDAVLEAVFKQGDELTRARRELRERTAELMRYKSAELLSNAKAAGSSRLIVHNEAGLQAAELKQLAEQLTKEPDVIAVLFSECGDNVRLLRELLGQLFKLRRLQARLIVHDEPRASGRLCIG